MAPEDTAGVPERRGRHPQLRELIDTLLELVRDLADKIEHLPSDDVEQTRARFNATGELIWAALLHEARKGDA